MRTMIKNRLHKLLDTMQSMHKIIAAGDIQYIPGYAEDCCQAAAAIEAAVRGDAEASASGDGSGAETIFSLLSQYRREITALSGNSASGMALASVLVVLDSVLEQVKVLVSGLADTRLVVFMPYKAEMWDSMESIWMACREDPACECRVMPLPYYEYDQAGGGWKPCYDGARFPGEVEVTDYREYPLESVCPDLAYIHNPYDNCNYVTSIAPEYYSSELKKYVGKLVYVPYYVTSGFFSQWELPAYYNVDHIIIQSEFVKESLREMHYYHKLLPLGSPKLDKVVQTCRAGAHMPDGWKPFLEGKKVLMLNTSINCFLSNGNYMLRKLKLVFEVFKRQSSVALIWRPHPLLEATIRSIRPELLTEYQSLVEVFMSSCIGIWDDTQDITNTVALSDGYIGEDATSVVNLFLAAGKPVFILNNFITGRFTQEEKQRIFIADLISHKDRLWMTSGDYNALMCMDRQSGRICLVAPMEGAPKWRPAYTFLETREDTLYLSPSSAGQPMAYHIDSREQEPLFETQTVGKQKAVTQENGNLYCQRIICYENRMFYVPYLRNPMMEYNCNTKEWKIHQSCMDALLMGAKDKALAQKAINRELGITCGSQAADGYLWVTAPYTNQILQFSMADGTYSLHEVDKKDSGYSGIAVDRDYVWLAEVKNGDVVRWNRQTGETCRFCVSGIVAVRKRRYEEMPYSVGLINMGKWLIIGPVFANGLVKLDKETGEVFSLAADFFEYADQEANDYCPEYHGTCSFAKRVDDTTLLVQRRRDGKAAAIHVEDNTWSAFEPSLTSEDYKKLTAGEDGFEKTEKKYGFFCYESRIFSLEGFMDALAEGKLEDAGKRQMKELETMAANLDGTCGEKVHAYMMKALDVR